MVIAVKEVNKGVRTNRTGHFPTGGHRPMEHRMTYDSAWSDGPYQPRVAKKVPQRQTLPLFGVPLDWH